MRGTMHRCAAGLTDGSFMAWQRHAEPAVD